MRARRDRSFLPSKTFVQLTLANVEGCMKVVYPDGAVSCRVDGKTRWFSPYWGGEVEVFQTEGKIEWVRGVSRRRIVLQEIKAKESTLMTEVDGGPFVILFMPGATADIMSSVISAIDEAGAASEKSVIAVSCSPSDVAVYEEVWDRDDSECCTDEGPRRESYSEWRQRRLNAINALMEEAEQHAADLLDQERQG